MATKKAPRKRKVKAVEHPDVRDVVLKLTELETLRLSRYDSDHRAALNEMMLLKFRREQHLLQIDPKGVLASFDREITKTKVDVKEAEELGHATRAAIESRLDIKLTDYAFDDKTGVLHHVTSAPVALDTKET